MATSLELLAGWRTSPTPATTADVCRAILDDAARGALPAKAILDELVYVVTNREPPDFEMLESVGALCVQVGAVGHARHLIAHVPPSWRSHPRLAPIVSAAASDASDLDETATENDGVNTRAYSPAELLAAVERERIQEQLSLDGDSGDEVATRQVDVDEIATRIDALRNVDTDDVSTRVGSNEDGATIQAAVSPELLQQALGDRHGRAPLPTMSEQPTTRRELADYLQSDPTIRDAIERRPLHSESELPTYDRMRAPVGSDPDAPTHRAAPVPSPPSSSPGGLFGFSPPSSRPSPAPAVDEAPSMSPMLRELPPDSNARGRDTTKGANISSEPSVVFDDTSSSVDPLDALSEIAHIRPPEDQDSGKFVADPDSVVSSTRSGARIDGIAHPESTDGGRPSPVAAPPKQRSRWPLVMMALALLAGGGAAFVIYGPYDIKLPWQLPPTGAADPTAPAADAAALAELRTRGFQSPSTNLDGVLTELGQVAVGVPADKALLKAELLALKALLADTPNPDAMDDAVAAARAAGASDDQLRFASIVHAATDADPKEAKVDNLTGAVELAAAGTVLERQGNPEAVGFFQRAIGAQPDFFYAEARLVHAQLLYGDEVEGARRASELSKRHPVPLTTTLLRLSHLRGQLEGDPPGPAEGVLARCGWVDSAITYAQASDAETRSAAFQKLEDELPTPLALGLLGQLAFDAGDHTRALDLAVRAHKINPTIGAQRLLGEASVRLGDLQHLPDGGDTAIGTDLSALLAYESGDVKRIVELAASTRATDLVRLRRKRMLGLASVAASDYEALEKAASLGGDLVLVDFALDRGDLKRARAVIATWTDADSHPLRARRRARLLRYDEKLDEAAAALNHANDVRPTDVERALLAVVREQEAQAALEPFGDAKEGEDAFWRAFVLATGGANKAAQALVAGLEPPGLDAAQRARLAATLAFGAVGDERGKPLAEGLLELFPDNPDVKRAAGYYQLTPPP